MRGAQGTLSTARGVLHQQRAIARYRHEDGYLTANTGCERVDRPDRRGPIEGEDVLIDLTAIFAGKGRRLLLQAGAHGRTVPLDMSLTGEAHILGNRIGMGRFAGIVRSGITQLVADGKRLDQRRLSLGCGVFCAHDMCRHDWLTVWFAAGADLKCPRYCGLLLYNVNI